MKVFGFPVLIYLSFVVVVVFKRKTFCGKCEQSVQFTNWKSLQKLEMKRDLTRMQRRGETGESKVAAAVVVAVASLELMLQMGHKSRRG